jgi:hypothetical protein
MTGLGNTFEIDGELEDDAVFGTMTTGQDGSLWFEAELDDASLYLTLVAPTADGQPDFDTATTLVFTRVGAEGAVAEPQPTQQGAQAGIHDGSKEGVEWADFLANMKATQMESYSSGSAGGYSSRTDYHLCANGQFFMTDENSVSVDVGGAYGYGGGSGSGVGTWRVVTQGQLVGIEFHHPNGEVSQHRLEYDYQSSATYVDGSRWYITPTDQCG